MSECVAEAKRIAADVWTVVAAIKDAETDALARHESGTCHLSEWSCSHCETERT